MESDVTGVRGAPVVVRAKLRAPDPVGVPRERLEVALSPLWQRRLGVVVAPAGSGKTTLLSQFAAAASVPVAWYRAEPPEGDAATFLAYVEAALTGALAGLAGGWGDVEAAAAALEAWPGSRALLVIDDLHALQGAPAEAALARLVRYAPPSLTFLVATRFPPDLDLPRLRVDGQVLDLGPDDLRFRSWEVERLFRDFYGAPLPPEDLAALARRTEGWAAGLQLFHLATRAKRPDERRRTLRELGPRWRLAREYLTDNVLAGLTEQQRRFLIETSVMGRLSGALCDELRGSTGSDALLAELERTRVFTFSSEDGWYRYHDVFRSHLEAVLAEEVGEAEARRRYRRAAALLEAAGAPADALLASTRAGDWSAVARLLGHEGERIARGPGNWLDALPPSIREHDPWVLLATARRHRELGHWNDALRSYRQAQLAFGQLAGAETCRRERLALTAWTGPSLDRPQGWLGLVRAAVARDPLVAATAAAALPGPHGSVAAGVALLLAGHARDALAPLAAAAEDPRSSPLLGVGARLATGAAGLLAGGAAAAADVEWAAEESERLGATWLAHVGRALLALDGSTDGRGMAEGVRRALTAQGDPWGSGLAALAAGLGALRAGQAPPVESLALAADAFAELGAGTLEAWCRAVAACAPEGPGPGIDPVDAALAARATATPGAQLFATLGMAVGEPGRAAEHRARAAEYAEATGLLPPPEPRLADAPADTAHPETADEAPEPVTVDGIANGRAPGPAAIAIRCFGGFGLRIGDRHLDTGAVKPRIRTLLRLLALSAGRPVHREAIIAALWPDVDGATGTRNLHVALAALRQALEPGVARGASSYVVRDGDAYSLALPDGSTSDVAGLDAALAVARRARVAGDAAIEERAYTDALDRYTGDLLPEDGPAEWVVGPREHYRAAAADAALALAELAHARGDRVAAAAACDRGLAIDRYRDGLWRLLIELHVESGDLAAAVHIRSRYDNLLAELGLGG